MVYRSLPFFTRVRQRGQANDLFVYLAVDAKELSIFKRLRSNKPSVLRSLQLTSRKILNLLLMIIGIKLEKPDT